MKLYLHIGWSKTGSSAIQAFLHHNQKALAAEHGILFPSLVSPDYLSGKGPKNHSHLWRPEEKLPQSILDLQKALDHAQEKGLDCILSAEAGGDLRFQRLIAEATKGRSIRIIVIGYLRRIDSWVEAAWKQWHHKRPELPQIEDYADKLLSNAPPPHLDYIKGLKGWAELADKEDILLKGYDRATLKDQDILADFLEYFGLQKDSKGFSMPPKNPLGENKGFSNKVVMLMNLCKPIYESRQDSRLGDLLTLALSERYSKQSFEASGLLPPSKAKALWESYLPIYEEISQIYTEGRPLFQTPEFGENEQWEHPSLSWEEAVPMILQTGLYLNERMDAQDREIQTLKRQLENLKKAKK